MRGSEGDGNAGMGDGGGVVCGDVRGMAMWVVHVVHVLCLAHDRLTQKTLLGEAGIHTICTAVC